MLLVPGSVALLDRPFRRRNDTLPDRERCRPDDQRKVTVWIRVRLLTRAESYLRFTGIADTAYFGPEAEFFIFDEARFHNEQYSSGYMVNSEEGHWNSGRSGDGNANMGFHIRAKEGYVPCRSARLADRYTQLDLVDTR